LLIHRTFIEAVPCIAAEARQNDIRHNGADAKRLARKGNVERVAHEAAAAIGADEMADTNLLFASLPTSRAVTPSLSCSSPISSHPNSGRCPSSWSRSRITRSVRNCSASSGR
jgi:hypothetical protein